MPALLVVLPSMVLYLSWARLHLQINLCKEDSLYNDGMRPLLHSAAQQAEAGLGWHRAGEKVAYYTNNIRRSRSKR
jgi:hypothetical protein